MFDFLRRVLLLELPPSLAGNEREEWLRFLMRWQQFTGPIMAKGYEDTSLYIYNRLVSMNEVGGDPCSTGVSVGAFHGRCETMAGRWPYSMNATSTHDTKRSEDVRARINVLSEIPEEWEKRLQQWSRQNAGKKRIVNGIASPDPGEEILLYQTLLGAWPLRKEELPGLQIRIENYMMKAMREAKVNTRWIRHNIPHEGAVKEFVASLLEDPSPDTNAFLADFLPFQRKVAHYGAINGLAQLLLKIASPGVPDIYQGMELWDFSLVDPDNRRPVDYRHRTRLLNELMTMEREGLDPLARGLLSSWEDGRIKLFVTCKALSFRRERKELFLDGAYVPLRHNGRAEGTRAGVRAETGRCMGDRGGPAPRDPPGAAGGIPRRPRGLGGANRRPSAGGGSGQMAKRLHGGDPSRFRGGRSEAAPPPRGVPRLSGGAPGGVAGHAPRVDPLHELSERQPLAPDDRDAFFNSMQPTPAQSAARSFLFARPLPRLCQFAVAGNPDMSGQGYSFPSSTTRAGSASIASRTRASCVSIPARSWADSTVRPASSAIHSTCSRSARRRGALAVNPATV